MGIYNGTFRTAAELSATARGAADALEAGDLLTQYLPSVETYDLDYNLAAGERGLPKAASFRAYDATAPYGQETSIGSKKGTLPPASIKLALGELARLRLRQASDDAIGAELDRKSVALGQAIAIRAILARGEVIATGKVTLAGENGIFQEIDFGRNSDLMPTVGASWATTSTDVIADVIAWQNAYRAINGGNAPAALLSSQILAYLQLNTGIIKAAVRDGASTLSRVSREDVLSVLASFGGITEVNVYDEAYKGPDGANTRVIAEDRFILGPSRNGGIGESGPLGVTQWGVPAEALNETYGIDEGDRPGIFAAQLDRTDPEGSDVLGSSIFLPINDEVDRVLSVDVVS